jgi:thiamine monophosphate synthase
MSNAQIAPPELILVFEAVPSARDFLAATLRACPPVCVIIAAAGGLPAPDDVGPTPQPAAAFDRDIAATLLADCQAAGIAGLIAEHVALATSLGADGVHLTCSEDLATRQDHARKALGPSATVGILSDRTRHTAMVAGEAGADYLAFDLRPGAPAEGLDRIAWWVELFEIPAVALVGFDADRAREATNAGAEFLALTPPLDGTLTAPALLDQLRRIISAAA